MAIVKHKVLELSYIGGALVQPGAVVDHEDGKSAGSNLKKASAQEIVVWQEREVTSRGDIDPTP